MDVTLLKFWVRGLCVDRKMVLHNRGTLSEEVACRGFFFPVTSSLIEWLQTDSVRGKAAGAGSQPLTS